MDRPLRWVAPLVFATTAALGQPAPELTPTQKDLLRRLQLPRSKVVWSPVTGTPAEIETAVATGQRREAPRLDHARAFLKSFGALWNLESLDSVRLRDLAVSRVNCSSVLAELVGPEGLPVFGATLRIELDGDLVRRVRGQLDGGGREGERPTEAGKYTAAMARDVLRKKLGASEIELPVPVDVRVEPLYLGATRGRATRGWLFAREKPLDAKDARLSFDGAFVVDQHTGAVLVDGRGSAGTSSPCGVDPLPTQPVVFVDPLTETPTLVDFVPMGGLPTSGLDPTRRARELLSRPLVQAMFGDRNNERHLRHPVVRPGAAERTHVRFREYFAGLPVEGAYLTVTLRGATAETITGRFVYFPTVDTERTVAGSTAVAAARGALESRACRDDGACIERWRKGGPGARPTLSILSSRIYPEAAMPPRSERLAWRVELPGWVAWIQATKEPVLLYAQRTDLSAFPSEVRNLAANDHVDYRDGSATGGPPPANPDSERVNGAIATIDAFYSNLGLSGFDDNNAKLVVHVGMLQPNAYWCTSGLRECSDDEIAIGVGFAVADVLGHEFTHAVTEKSADLIYAFQSGALNESYSDVFGELIFPDRDPGSWRVGQDLPGGAIRDMHNPGTRGHPQHVGQIAPCTADDDCVHSWSGIPNRAAVHVADGGTPGSPHGGLGRDGLARLYLETLRTRMTSSDQFLQQRVNTIATCTATRPAADCDHVGRSFDAVGVLAVPFVGWTRFDSAAPVDLDVPKNVGLRLFRDCTVSDLVLFGVDKDGRERRSTAADGLNITFNGEWGAYVTRRASDADPADREHEYHIWSNWFEAGLVDTAETYAMGPGVTQASECELPCTNCHARALFASQRSAHWATLFNGGRDDETLNDGVRMPAGCILLGLTGVEYHSGASQGAATEMDHENHGFRISRQNPGDPQSLAAAVHWWHDGVSGIFVRPAYLLAEPNGVDCAAAGSVQNDP